VTRRQLGSIYRVLGPTIQIVGIVFFFAGLQSQKRVAGVPLNVIGLVLVAVGLVMVVAGLWLSFKSKKEREDAEESEYRLRL
jgi:uncharacterized membrane protein YqhA